MFTLLLILGQAGNALDGSDTDLLLPQSRAVAIMALVGLVVLGIGLVALVLLGGRWARRLARPGLAPTRPRRPGAATSLAKPPEPPEPPGHPSDTASSDETLSPSEDAPRAQTHDDE